MLVIEALRITHVRLRHLNPQLGFGIWGHALCDFFQTPTKGGKLRMYPVRSFYAHEISEYLFMIDPVTGEI